ncbi:HNH endonuclease [Micrococcus sp. NPDC078436]|uniref:HNH endonuclease n=1 Tax=Micrococcus sp. NPDC078436 TaxID=3154960 RepID=UPI00344F68C3
MPWLKVSDASAMHPIALAALETDDADDRLVNELFGYVCRCAVMSAQHEQDYVVTLATARVTAGGDARFRALAGAAERAGYWTRTVVKDATGAERPAFRLVQEKDLFHMLLKAERAWETQRRADVANAELTVPVRLRDGDGCRWCGKTVAWRDRKSGRGATYDHVHPGQGAASPEDLVVACRACNGARKDEENTSFDRTLMQPPERPFYGADTLAFLAEHDVVPSTPEEPASAAPQAAPSSAAEQAPRRESAPGPVTAARFDAAGSTAGAATAAPLQGVRDTATRPERPRADVVRGAGASGVPAGAGPAQRERVRRGVQEREQSLDDWLAARGIAPPPAPSLTPLDLEEAEWVPELPEEVAEGLDLQILADRQAEGSGFPGSGRVGKGREGLGLVGHGQGSGWDGSGLDGDAAGEGQGRRRRRGRRGGRGRGGGGQ